MSNYTIRKVRTDRFGSVEPHFAGPDGKLFPLPIVGHVWVFRATNNGAKFEKWEAKDTVVESKRYGLLRFTPFKSRCTKAMVLSEGEVYLPLEKTGRSLVLEVLPE